MSRVRRTVEQENDVSHVQYGVAQGSFDVDAAPLWQAPPRRNVYLDCKTPNGQNCLAEACRYGRLKVVLAILKTAPWFANYAPAGTHIAGWTALHCCFDSNSTSHRFIACEMVEALLPHMSAVTANMQTEVGGHTPLHLAVAAGGNRQLLNVMLPHLVCHGGFIDPTIRNYKGKLPADIALCTAPKLVRLLLGHGLKTSLTDLQLADWFIAQHAKEQQQMDAKQEKKRRRI
jgi:hypothetical protein